MKNVFTDCDGTKYYQNTKGDLFRGDSKRLLELAEEFNVRKHLRDLDEFEAQSKQANLMVGKPT